MSTLLMKVHTDAEQCKKECNRKSKIVWSGHQHSSQSLSTEEDRLILPKQLTMKGKTHAMPPAQTLSYYTLFSLFCFLQRSWIRKHFIGVFRSMPCLMDISDPYRPKTTAGRHSWCLTSKMQTIIYCTKSTYGY